MKPYVGEAAGIAASTAVTFGVVTSDITGTVVVAAAAPVVVVVVVFVVIVVVVAY